MAHERNRGESRMDLSDVVEALGVLSGLVSGNNERLERIEGEIAAARRTATRRSERVIQAMINYREMIARFVAGQTKLTDNVAANSTLITKMIEEIRKAHDASGEPIPAEVESVLAAFEANVEALATATAAGTAAIPADIPVPPVVEAPAEPTT